MFNIKPFICLSQTGSYGSDGGGGGGVTTIAGDSGTATGSTITFTGSGTPLEFVAAGSTVTLTWDSNVPVDQGGTGADTFTAYSILCAGTTSTGAFQNVVGVGTSGQILKSNGAGALPSWETVPTSSISITGDSGGALTGASFTFTGSGTPFTFVGSGTTETLTWASTVPVAHGGTGASTLTAHGVLLGEGTSAVTAISPGTNGQVLLGATSSDPTWQTPAAGTGLTLTTDATHLSYALTVPVVVSSGGTGVQTIAAHSLLIGEGTSAIANTGAGSAGQVILSGGASADPAWVTPTATSGGGLAVTTNASTLSYGISAPVSVANGGTGDTSLTAYAVLCGGTTTTAAVQSIASVGTSGQVLTSNGAGALPTFQAASGGGISTIDGDSGSVTGSTIEITGGTTGITFSGSSTTLTAAANHLNLPQCTSSTTGVLNINSEPFLHNFGAATDYNTFVGYEAGNFTLTSGTAVDNSGFGYEALNALTTGTDNTAIGYEAGLKITSGSKCTAVGSGALAAQAANSGATAVGYNALNVNTATGNTAVGYQAGVLITSSAGNTAMGYQSLATMATTSSGNNTAIGYQALNASTGAGNTAVGNSAGVLISSGADCTAVGAGSLAAQTTNSGSTAIGFNALNANTATGSTGIGYEAAYLNSSGSGNTAVGYSALAALTTTNYNTALGYQAGLAATGHDGVYIGYQAGSAVTSGSDNVFIGYTAGQGTSSTGGANVAIGSLAAVGAIGNYNTLIGYSSANGGLGSNNTLIGYNNGLGSSGNYCVVIGDNTAENVNSVVTLGHGVSNSNSNSLVIGNATGTGNGQLNIATICGIDGSTSSSGVEVYINSSNVLGTSTSTRDAKENVQDMGSDSEVIYKLRPVTFTYKPERTELHEPQEQYRDLKQYGLIAEEVEEVDPDLVKYDLDGKPQTVRYHFITRMLLNEVQKLRKELDDLKAQVGVK